jgi:hypothetical protein
LISLRCRILLHSGIANAAAHGHGLALAARKWKYYLQSRRIIAQCDQQKQWEQTPMDVPMEQETPDHTAAGSTSSDLIKLVQKLRWAGLDEEADRLLKKLKSGPPAAKDSVVTVHNDTD